MDVLKPRELSIVELAKASKTETLKVTIRGANIDYESVSKIMDQYGVSIRGIDEINVAKEWPS